MKIKQFKLFVFLCVLRPEIARSLKNLIKKMMTKEPVHRITLPEIKVLMHSHELWGDRCPHQTLERRGRVRFCPSQTFIPLATVILTRCVLSALEMHQIHATLTSLEELKLLSQTT